MNLSKYIGTTPDYLEYAWVCAPNAAAQTIAEETITPLTLTAKVADTGNIGSAPSGNVVTIPAGMYYFEAIVPVVVPSFGYNVSGSFITSLYNNTASAYITRLERPCTSNSVTEISPYGPLSGQFALAVSSGIVLKVLLPYAGTIGLPAGFTTATGATDNQRTTLKLWKLQ